MSHERRPPATPGLSGVRGLLFLAAIIAAGPARDNPAIRHLLINAPGKK
jgi:hypothetical protein